MCLSCGCCEPDNDHHDSRHITMLMLTGAACAAGIPLLQAAENIVNCISGQLITCDATEVCEAVKAAGADAAYSPMVKSEAQRFTLGPAYAANLPDAGVALDGHQDFVGPDALEQTAWNYLRKGYGIGLFHRDNTQGHAEVVESYIYRGPDWQIRDDYVIKAGDWMLGAIWDKIGWSLVQKGFVNGWSPQGKAARRVPSEAALAGLRR